jgi:membrane protein implicated in regulation of membrane protease activity
MENVSWILWFVIGVVFMILEVFTLGFVLFWFGIGALAASLVGFAGLGIVWQFITFLAVSGALTVMSRTIFSKYFSLGGGDEMKSGVDSLPGKIGTVTISSDGPMRTAAVKVFGSTWTAYPMDGDTELKEGEKVEVVEVRGSSIFVRSATRELPGWRDD